MARKCMECPNAHLVDEKCWVDTAGGLWWRLGIGVAPRVGAVRVAMEASERAFAAPAVVEKPRKERIARIASEGKKARVDRNVYHREYMREYMRKRRAARRGE